MINLYTKNKAFKNKLGLLRLIDGLDNVSTDCKIFGLYQASCLLFKGLMNNTEQKRKMTMSLENF